MTLVLLCCLAAGDGIDYTSTEIEPPDVMAGPAQDDYLFRDQGKGIGEGREFR